MIIIVYSETTASNIESSLGRPEYSYYFVLKEFRPLLEQLGIVVAVADPAREVDAIYRNAIAHGQPCVFLSFSPPHKTEVKLSCPTIPIFAWEFNSIPNEIWFDEPRNDWRTVFAKVGSAITHSNFTVNTVLQAMTPDFPIVSLPAPVWDRFAARYDGSAKVLQKPVEIEVTGTVLDCGVMDVASDGACQHEANPRILRSREQAGAEPVRVSIDGVVYMSVFNPYDGRKNWADMMSAFCWAFREVEDATLVLKLTHSDVQGALDVLLETLRRVSPFKCRVIIIHGYLSDTEYEKLVSATSYVVNTSHGEGQCLPLMEFMSSGKPAIAPCNTAMTDYIDSNNAFVIDSDLEPSHWPDDPRRAYRTLRYRIDWGTLLNAYKESYRVAKEDPARYARMAQHAVQRLQQYCSRDLVQDRLVAFLANHPGLKRDRMALAAKVPQRDAQLVHAG